MLDEATNDIAILHSIIERMEGFLYRCRNDREYSMIYMAGDVKRLTGLDIQEFTGPRKHSYAGMTHPDDLEPVYKAVDDALAKKSNWQVQYRIRRADGSDIWVNEMGGGVFRGNELLYLEGIVLDTTRFQVFQSKTEKRMAAIAERTRALLRNTTEIISVLKTLRILAINARLEAGRAGPTGVSFGFVAQQLSALGDQTADMTESTLVLTGELQKLLTADDV